MISIIRNFELQKAAFHTSNAGVEAAMNWMMEHMDDADLNTPFVNPAAAASKTPSASAFVPDPDAMANLMAMSFSEAQAKKALKNTQVRILFYLTHSGTLVCFLMFT